MTSLEEVTVAVIALDEEHRIGPTLESALGQGFPVLVVDGGSRDRTVAIARAAGCQVIVRPFTEFADQRNSVLEECGTPFVLFVDADELLHPELAAEVRDCVARGVDAAWIPTLDYFAGRWLLHGGWYPQPHLRLLKASCARYRGAVHERVSFIKQDPVIVHIEQPLLHRSHMTVGHYIRKLDRYTDIEAATTHGRPATLVARGVAEAVAVLVRRLLLQRGWRDGAHGVVGAVLYALYRFTLYAKAATTATVVDEPTPEAALARLRRRQGR